MRPFIGISLFVFAVIAARSPASAQSTLTLNVTTGHPGIATTLSGAGFADGEAVDVYVDTTDTLLLVSGATGTLTGTVTIPASAQPGTHYVTAIGRRSGDAAQTAFKVTTSWSEFGFGATHRAWNPYENTVNTSNVSTLGELWSVAAKGTGATPAIAGGKVVIATLTGVQARATGTGALSWNKLTTDYFYSSPAISGNNVYIGGGSGKLYALSLTTGATLWTTTLGATIYASPVVSGGIVYIGAGNSNFYAVNAKTGTILWSYTTGAYIDASAAVDNGVVYFGSTDTKIYALNAATGALAWSYTAGGEIEGGPTISNGLLFVGADDGKIYALYTENGEVGTLAWSFQTNGDVFANCASAAGIVYAASEEGTLYGLNARSGNEVFATVLTANKIVRGMIVANGVLYLTAQDGFAYALDTYGNQLAAFATGTTYFGTPAISDGVLYVNSLEGGVFAYALLANVDALPVRPPVPSTLRPDFSLRE